MKPDIHAYLAKQEFTATVITLSDRASRGEYQDLSGQELAQILQSHFAAQGLKIGIERIIIPDEKEALHNALAQAIKQGTQFIFSTGSTGIGPRDIAPEVVRPLLDKEIPGIMELIRVKYGMSHPNAALSRSIAGTAGCSLIYALPGSPKAVREYMEEILKTLLHCSLMLNAIDGH